MDRNNMNILVRLLSVGTTVCALLASCGGGGGNDTPAPNIFGVAEGDSNAPLINSTVNVSCAKGSALATTNSTGAWQVALSGQTPPCAVKVSGGTIHTVANTQLYHSIAVNQGTVNVTPLTDLMVANLAGTATPSTWFAGLSANPAPLTAITQTQVNTSLANLSTVLSGLPPLSTINPITTVLTFYSGNVISDMQAAFATAISNTPSVTYATLLGDAATSTTAGPSFNAALLAAYAGITTSQPVTASNLSTNYSAQTGVSTNLTFVPDPNNSLSQVLQMTLGANDPEAASSHRTEIIPNGGSVIVDTTAPANSVNARWYAFNFYIPSTWVPITGGNIFAQIHGNDNITGNPVVALGATGSNLWLGLNYNTNLFGSATPPTHTNQTSNSIPLGTVTPGTWYLFVVYADWSYTPGKGSLSIWLNGTSIYSNTNTPNCYDTSYGSYPSNYAKTGIYAWNGLNAGQASAYILSRGIVIADPSATYTQVVAAFPIN